MSNYLLDSHIFLWAVTLDPRLKPAIADLIRDRSNAIYLSVVSGWEIAIKVGLGKLEVDRPVGDLVGVALEARGVSLLPISVDDLEAYSKLVMLESGHRDPFDRMLIVQAAERGLTLLTSDPALKPYGKFVQVV